MIKLTPKHKNAVDHFFGLLTSCLVDESRSNRFVDAEKIPLSCEREKGFGWGEETLSCLRIEFESSGGGGKRGLPTLPACRSQLIQSL